ncbi:MAG: hypothetical protein PVI23_10330 [Maricaulaceae bacterium]|jgi:hypothetical protein
MSRVYVPSRATDLSERSGGLSPLYVGGGLAALTAAVFAAAFFAGRMLGPDNYAPPARQVETSPPAAVQDASSSARQEPANNDAQTAPAETSAPAPRPIAPPDSSAATEPDLPAAGPFADFDMRLLHPDVIGAVTAAREAQAAALDAERRAQAAARRADAAQGGAGELTFPTGDRYAGEVADGSPEGVGVYTWADPAAGTYAGQFTERRMDGLGARRWPDGAAYLGERDGDARHGHGVFVDGEGGGYEGSWRNGAPDGHGVVWNADGTVRSQGLWASNTLVEAWIVPPPAEDDAGTEEADGDDAPAP